MKIKFKSIELLSTANELDLAGELVVGGGVPWSVGASSLGHGETLNLDLKF